MLLSFFGVTISILQIHLLAQGPNCACEELFMAIDCLSCFDQINCVWENQRCRKKQCSDFKDQKSCTWYANYRLENLPQCYWKESNNTCMEWNDCAEIEILSPKNLLNCQFYGCTPENITSNQCKSQYLNSTINYIPSKQNCTTLANQNCDESFLTISGQVCYWDAKNSRCENYKNCSEIKNPVTCKYLERCDFVNQTCQTKKCDIYTPLQCAIPFATPLSSRDGLYLICKISSDGKKCIEGFSADLNSTSCYEQTFFTSSFDSNQCRKCGLTLSLKNLMYSSSLIFIIFSFVY